MKLEITKVKITKVDDTVSPPEIYIKATISVDGKEHDHVVVYSADDIDIRGRDENGNLIIRPID